MPVSKYIKEMFDSVDPGWKKVLATGAMKQELSKAIKGLQQELDSHGVTDDHLEIYGLGKFLRPSPDKIFEAFKYFPPSDLKVIIIGQDPYLKPQEASGMSFSVPSGVKIPPTLSNIYKCWNKNKFIYSTPKHGNLTNIANQGVLFLNRYFTRSPVIEKDGDDVKVTGNGSSKQLHKFWGEFTDALVKHMTSDEFKRKHKLKNQVFVLMWGNKAKEIAGCIENNGIGLFWRHPSPLASTNEKDEGHFIYCDHFTKVNEIYPEIKWNPDYGEKKIDPNATDVEDLIVVYTDGSYNMSDGTAGYSAYFSNKIGDEYITNVKEFVVYGRLQNKKISMHNHTRKISYRNEEKVKATSQRAEMYAMIMAMNCVLEMTKTKTPDSMPRIVLISDSSYTIRCMVNMIWKKIKEDKGLRNVNANRDMVVVLCKQLMMLMKRYDAADEMELFGKGWKLWEKKLSQRGKTLDSPGVDTTWRKLTIAHQKSHQCFVGGNELEIDKWKGNNMADEYANKGRKGNELFVKEML